jgi:hypothetical protein
MTTEATSFIPQTSEKITKVRWRSLRKAKRILGYDNLARLLARVEHKLVVTHP